MAKPKVSVTKPKKSPKAKGGGGKFSWRLLFLGIMAVALMLDFAFSFVPHKSVPDSLKGFHNQVLCFRNNIVAKTGIPVSRYEDSANIPTGAEPLRVYFAPSPKISTALDDFILSAQKSVSVCAYEIDLPDVADALLNEYRRGISVRIVTDTDNFKSPEIQRLVKTGIQVKQDHKPSIMHNKFVVVDGHKVWTGSYNFTKN